MTDPDDNGAAQPDRARNDPVKLSAFSARASAAGTRAAQTAADAVARMHKEPLEKMAQALRASYKIKPAPMPQVDHLRRLQEWSDEQRAQMEALGESIADAQAEKLEREESQVRATLEIADAQQRLQELQGQAVQLAEQQASATAKVALAQQAVLDTIREELAVLKVQADDTRRLVRSNWTSGALMQWTLFVAIMAAASTAIFAWRDPVELSPAFWIAALVLLVASGLGIALWQKHTRPPE